MAGGEVRRLVPCKSFFFYMASLWWLIALVAYCLCPLRYVALCIFASASMFIMHYYDRKVFMVLNLRMKKQSNSQVPVKNERDDLTTIAEGKMEKEDIQEHQGEKNTIISSGVSFEGNITSGEHVYIYGSVYGNITNKNGVVKINQGGILEGEVYCRDLIVDGQVKGHCRAQNIDVFEHGSIQGDMVYSILSIKKGGKLIGELKLCEKEPAKNELTTLAFTSDERSQIDHIVNKPDSD